MYCNRQRPMSVPLLKVSDVRVASFGSFNVGFIIIDNVQWAYPCEEDRPSPEHHMRPLLRNSIRSTMHRVCKFWLLSFMVMDEVGWFDIRWFRKLARRGDSFVPQLARNCYRTDLYITQIPVLSLQRVVENIYGVVIQSDLRTRDRTASKIWSYFWYYGN